MNRMKKCLSLVLSLLLMLTVLAPAVSAEPEAPVPADGELLLATMSDIHYYPESLAQYQGEAFYDYLRGHNCVYENLDGILDSAFAAVKRDVEQKGLKYLVLTGDLTTNGEYEGHAALAERLKALEADTGVHVYVINGNHDLNNADAAAFVTPDGKKTPAKKTTAADFYEIYYELGFNEAVSMYSAPDTGKAGALSYAVEADNFRFIFIDAGKYTADNTAKARDEHETGGHITDGVLDWIRAQTDEAKAKGQTPIAFTHWNLSEMNYMHGEILQGFVIDDGYVLQETFADMGIHYVFSGHQHVSDADVTYSDAGEKLVSVITPILTQYPFAFRESTFTVTNGEIDAEFEMLPVDDAKAVYSRTGEKQSSPYRVTGFKKQFGGAPETYLMYLVRGLLSDWVNEIRESGSIVTFIRDEFGFDIEQKLTEYIPGGLVVGDNEIFTVKNIMSLIADIDQQLVARYIDQPENLWNALEKTIKGLVDTKVSDVPCTAFINTYGFGNKKKGGTLGDLFFSIMVYMYCGNEDASGDAFMNDVYEKSGDPAFVDLIFNAVLDNVLDGLILDELLGHVTVNLQALLNGKNPSVADFIRMFYRFVTAVASERGTEVSGIGDFFNKMYSIFKKLDEDDSAASFASLADMVLGTGLISYGSSVREVAENLLNQYFGDKEKAATAEQLQTTFDTILHDDDLDWSVEYDYAGPEPVIPTVEDMQLPNALTLGVDGDVLTVHWTTKYSVTGTDFEIFEPDGTPVDPANIKTETIGDTITRYGFSFGSFGILPYTRITNRHLVTVTGLKPGAAYMYRAGDAEKDFWCEQGTVTIPDESNVSFLFVNNAVPATRKDREKIAENLKKMIDKAKPSFLLLAGDSVLNGADDGQMTDLLNAMADVLGEIPVRYVTGAAEIGESAFATRHFGVKSSDHYNDGLAGVSYSFNVGGVHVAALSAADLDARTGKLSYTQEKWLKEDMAAHESDSWRIITIAADALGNADNSTLKSNLLGLMSDLKIDLLLMGGDAYYRSHPIVEGNPAVLDAGEDVKLNGRTYPTYEKQGVGVAVTVPGIGDERAEVVAEEGAFAKTAETDEPACMLVTLQDHVLAADFYALSYYGYLTRYDAFALVKEEYKRLLGDLNEDGQITAADARLSLRAAVGLDPLSELLKIIGDADRDYSLTAADARKILRAAVGLETIEPEWVTVYASDFGKIN
ncbi:MAG: metallophosphoesterase [Clostridia bacterium]|nr:metallophosphoesterase [Clostridia bacterium]